MRTPIAPTVVVLFVAGAALGYGMLAAGPIIALLAVFLMILLLSRREQLGSYLAGIGLSGSAVLGHLVLTCAAPSCHYDSSTVIGLAGFGIVTIAGVCLLGWALARRA